MTADIDAVLSRLRERPECRDAVELIEELRRRKATDDGAYEHVVGLYHAADEALRVAERDIAALTAERDRLREAANTLAAVRADATWMARLARVVAWPGEMAHLVETAAERVLSLLGESPAPAAPPTPPERSGRMGDVEIVLGIEHTELRQRHKHTPGASPAGDCYRTAIACLISAPDPRFVPHFVDLAGGEEIGDAPPWEHYRLARHWLRDDLGLDLCPVDVEAAVEFDVAYMVSVQSQTGPWGHCVIAKRGEVVHDPSGRDYSAAEPDEPLAWVITKPYEPGPDELFAEWIALAADEHTNGPVPTGEERDR